jgi:lysophospholipid acyltransferase (LPLAT)-like uncharacterized protein
MRKKLKRLLMVHIVPPLVYIFLLMLRLTLRVEHRNREALDRLWADGGNAIFCFWHGRLLAMPFAYNRGRGKVLVSRHRDGEFITRVIGYFGLGTVRGSHKKEGAVSSLREMLKELRSGTDMAITPDGPKGPRYEMKQGLVELARLSQYPVVLVAYSANRKKIFNSWDRFLLPYPFSKILFLWSDPIYISKEVDSSKVELQRKELEQALIAVTEKVDQLACGS